MVHGERAPAERSVRPRSWARPARAAICGRCRRCPWASANLESSADRHSSSRHAAFGRASMIKPRFMAERRALITGIPGQDGSYLSRISPRKELRSSRHRSAHRAGGTRNISLRLQNMVPRLHLHAASLESYASIYQVVAKVAQEECYHLAAQSFFQLFLRRRIFHLATTRTSTAAR